jgi:DNA-damage-inducible protein D
MDKIQMKKLFDAFNDASHEVDGIEVWYGRDLMALLGYTKWDNFCGVVEKAKIACKNAQNNEIDHFADVRKMIEAGKGAIREIDDIVLTRYACYLIAMEADSRKIEVAFAKTYFAIQARKFELLEKSIQESIRSGEREKLSFSEKMFSQVIYQTGIDGYGLGRIRSKGDMALFGFTTAEMKKRLGAKDNRPLGDFLHTVAVSAKEFAAHITAYNVNQNNLQGEATITTEHIKNNTNAREALLKSGIYPENLPAQDDIKKVARKINSDQKKLAKNTRKLKSPDPLFNQPRV